MGFEPIRTMSAAAKEVEGVNRVLLAGWMVKSFCNLVGRQSHRSESRTLFERCSRLHRNSFGSHRLVFQSVYTEHPQSLPFG